MPQILIVDAGPLFREYIKNKLIAERISVELVQGRFDAYTKMLSLLPDLIIIDEGTDITTLEELMEQKHNNPNTNRIPTIVAGPPVSSDTIINLTQMGVTHYFSKPFQFDLLYEAIARLFKTKFALDQEPCYLEAYLNGNLAVINIAEGLNLDKINLLKYHLTDLIKGKHLTAPFVLLIMTGISLNFLHGIVLEQLLNNIITIPGIHTDKIKILTHSDFTSEFIAGHKEYKGIQVHSQLIPILNELVDSTQTHNIQTLITDNILIPEQNLPAGSVDLRFHSECEERKHELESVQL